MKEDFMQHALTLEAVNAIARWLDEHGVELPVLV